MENRLAPRLEKRYNKIRMVAETLRVMLAVCLLAMYILAMLFLRRRRLTVAQFIGWVALALFLPALGPFLVLLLRPGRPADSDEVEPIRK